jgi:hypothetical protein
MVYHPVLEIPTQAIIGKMCTLSNLSRADYHRWLTPAPKQVQEDLKLRNAMQRIALDWPAYGNRRMTRALRATVQEVNALLKRGRLWKSPALISQARESLGGSRGTGPPANFE